MAANERARSVMLESVDAGMEKLLGASASSSCARQERYAQAFANVVAVLMRDATFRKMPIAELEWLVLPPIMSGQWRLARSNAESTQAKASLATDGMGTLAVPAAVVLWASLSEDIDTRLRETPHQPLYLKPSEWLSGNCTWVVAAAGEPRVVRGLLENLADTDFKERSVSLRTISADGEPRIGSLQGWLKPRPLAPSVAEQARAGRVNG